MNRIILLTISVTLLCLLYLPTITNADPTGSIIKGLFAPSSNSPYSFNSRESLLKPVYRSENNKPSINWSKEFDFKENEGAIGILLTIFFVIVIILAFGCAFDRNVHRNYNNNNNNNNNK
jgi:hypothetical protein